MITKYPSTQKINVNLLFSYLTRYHSLTHFYLVQCVSNERSSMWNELHSLARSLYRSVYSFKLLGI